MSKKWSTLCGALIVLQIIFVWYVTAHRARSKVADARIAAQRQCEFDELANMHSLKLASLERIAQKSPVRLTAHPDMPASVGKRRRYHGVMYMEDSGDQIACVGYLDSSTCVRSFDPGRELVAVDTKEDFHAVLARAGAGFVGDPGVDVKSSATFMEDRQGKVSELTGFVTVNGKIVDARVVLPPLFFPERAVMAGDEWSLDLGSEGANRRRTPSKVSQATARLSEFVLFESKPCAKIEAQVVSFHDPSTIFSEALGIAHNRKRTELRVHEARAYIVRIADGVLLWCEIATDFGSDAKMVTRLKLLED